MAEYLLDRSSEARRNGDRETAYRFAEAAADRSRSSGDVGGLGAALAALGRLRRDDGELDAAAELYEQAASIASERGDALGLAHRLRHIGDIVAMQGDLARAEQCYDEAGALIEQHEVTDLNRANFLRSRALLREKQGAAEAAAQLWSEARTLYAAAGIGDGVEESERRLAALKNS